jgi:ZIP family zinc transporter
MSAATDLFTAVAGDSVFVQALAGGAVIAGVNLLGASLVLLVRDPSERFLDGTLGFAAGVMLDAAFTSLILPGIEAADGDPLPVLFGVLLGAAFLDQTDRFVPHAHYHLTGNSREDAANPSQDVVGVDDATVASVVLFILAVTLHNMPEGLAVGVGFGNAANAVAAEQSAALADALALTLAIGI